MLTGIRSSLQLKFIAFVLVLVVLLMTGVAVLVTIRATPLLSAPWRSAPERSSPC